MPIRSLVRRWLADASHLVHVSVLIVLPLIIFLVIELRTLSRISYFVFPPLASAAFTIFFDPDGTYSTAPRLVGGLTLGAAVGWLSFHLFGFGGLSAGMSVFLTGLVTWPLDLEHPSAFSTALLAVVLRADSLLYIGAVFASTLLVAVLFAAWRRYVYEERAQYLYDAIRDEDRILVPVRDRSDAAVVQVCAQIAEAHDAGRLVLLSLPGDEELLDAVAPETDLPVERVVPAPGTDPLTAVRDAIDRYDCSVVGVGWEEPPAGDQLSPFTRDLFGLDTDVLVFRLDGDSGPWRDAFVPVRGAGKVSRLMVEIGSRIVTAGTVSATTVIDDERQRRNAEKQLFDLVSAFQHTFTDREDLIDTRIIDAADHDVEQVLVDTSEQYDVTLIGASTDRPLLSRILTPPTITEIVHDLDTPLIIVHSSASGRSIPSRLRDILPTAGADT